MQRKKLSEIPVNSCRYRLAQESRDVTGSFRDARRIACGQFVALYCPILQTLTAGYEQHSDVDKKYIVRIYMDAVQHQQK